MASFFIVKIKLFFLLPVFDLLQSVINLYYKIIGICSKSKNFTWQNL